MSLNKQQQEFAKNVGLLLHFIYSKGYSCTFGDAWAKKGEGRSHSDNSFHYKRLAIDLNLFSPEGEYLTQTKDHEQFGAFWKNIGGTWGGDFTRQDGNHYSWGE